MYIVTNLQKNEAIRDVLSVIIKANFVEVRSLRRIILCVVLVRAYLFPCRTFFYVYGIGKS